MGSRYKFTVDLSAKHANVSGSNILICVHHPMGEIKFLVDCGLYQGEQNNDEKNYARFDYDPRKLDFVLLTHNHVDHTGRIPYLFKCGYYKKVYTTQDTKAMLPIAFENNEKIISINAQKNCKKALYNWTDVEQTLKNVIAMDFEETFIPHEYVKVTFFKNAHLIGAAVVLVQISCEGYDDLNLLFTGDYKKSNIFFNVPQLPEWVRKLPLHIVCESTYGKTDFKETNEPMFVKNIVEWLDGDVNTVVIPALSLGRFQEIAYILKCAQKDNLISTDIPIRFDGNLAIKYTNLYKYSLDILPEMRDFMPINYTFVENTAREGVINCTDKQIIVTTSGMGCFGPAQEYIPRLIERKDVGIHFTSFLSPDSFGYKLLHSPDGEIMELNSVLKRKIAQVKNTKEFSSHAKRDELIEFISQFEDVRSLHFVHGEEDVKVDLASYAKETLTNCKEITVLGMGYTIRVNFWGVVKSVREKM